MYIVADAGYGSEENYLNIMDEFEKVPLIAYGMYHQEKNKKYKNNLNHRDNWYYDETEDSYTDLDGSISVSGITVLETIRMVSKNNFKFIKQILNKWMMI